MARSPIIVIVALVTASTAQAQADKVEKTTAQQDNGVDSKAQSEKSADSKARPDKRADKRAGAEVREPPKEAAPRTRRRVRVRSSVTVIDPRSDLADIISKIRRVRSAGGEDRGRRDAKGHKGKRQRGRAARLEPQRWDSGDDGRARRATRLRRDGDTTRRRVDRDKRTRRQHRRAHQHPH